MATKRGRRIALFGIGLMVAVLDAQPSFEVASVKRTPPGREGPTAISPSGAGTFTAMRASLEVLIGMAFGMDSNRISGQPKWMESEYPDVVAKPAGEKGLTYEELRPLLQQLLAQRFKLVTHNETRDVQGYALVVAKSGAKLVAGKDEPTSGLMILPGGLRGKSVSLEVLASLLSRPVGRPVVDTTGIKGTYDINLNYAPEGVEDSPLPSVFTALQEQLGLRLTPQKVPAQALVIDRVEKIPTEN